MRDISIVFLAAAVFAASACSDHTDPVSPVDEGPPPTSRSVDVQDDQFVAASVRVATGGTVRWTWRGGNLHNVSFTDGRTSLTQTNGTFERTFDAPGSYRYSCTVHGQSMSGTVTVVAP